MFCPTPSVTTYIKISHPLDAQPLAEGSCSAFQILNAFWGLQSKSVSCCNPLAANFSFLFFF